MIIRIVFFVSCFLFGFVAYFTVLFMLEGMFV